MRPLFPPRLPLPLPLSVLLLLPLLLLPVTFCLSIPSSVNSPSTPPSTRSRIISHWSRKILQEEEERFGEVAEEDEVVSGNRWISRVEEILNDGSSVTVERRHREEVLRHVWRSASVRSSLKQKYSYLSLCNGGASSSPFIQGTWLHHEHLARLTVFDVELLHNIKPNGFNEESGAPPTLSALAFLESGDSIKNVQWKGFGAATLDPTVENLRLRCRIYAGHNPADRFKQAPLYEVDAHVLSSIEWSSSCLVNIRCPLEEEKSFFKASEFQVELALQQTENSMLHLEPLPLCRRKSIRPLPSLKGNTWKQFPLQPLDYPGSLSGDFDSNTQQIENGNEEKSQTTISICIRAYHEHSLFHPSKGAKSTKKLLEFLDYHLLIGVSRFYFYDRYGNDMQKDLQPYIERGVVIFLPFPAWSEVFYRKEWFFNKSVTPYDFPAAYDQILNYEHCLMQGRRNKDTWMLFTDTDEFVQYPSQTAGSLPHVFDTIVKDHAKKNDGHDPTEISIERFNFMGANATGDLVLDRCTLRCESPIPQIYLTPEGEVDQWLTPGLKNKVALKPSESLGSQVFIHRTFGHTPEVHKAFPDPEVLRINHYRSTAQNRYLTELEARLNSPCTKSNNPQEPDDHLVEDKSLVWSAERILSCLKENGCEQHGKGVCGNLCQQKDV